MCRVRACIPADSWQDRARSSGQSGALKAGPGLSVRALSMSAFISAVLLAAGASRRMGTLKALLPWGGQPLIRHQTAALQEAGVDEVVVVLGHRADELRPHIGAGTVACPVRCTVNPEYAQGKTTSIRAGLRSLADRPEGAILLLNVDQPRSGAAIRQVLEAHDHGARTLITIPTCHGRGGHPIVLSRALLPELLAMDEATQGLRAVRARHRDDARRVALDLPELLWDINTPGQYREALDAAGGSDRAPLHRRLS